MPLMSTEVVVAKVRALLVLPTAYRSSTFFNLYRGQDLTADFATHNSSVPRRKKLIRDIFGELRLNPREVVHPVRAMSEALQLLERINDANAAKAKKCVRMSKEPANKRARLEKPNCADDDIIEVPVPPKPPAPLITLDIDPNEETKQSPKSVKKEPIASPAPCGSSRPDSGFQEDSSDHGDDEDEDLEDRLLQSIQRRADLLGVIQRKLDRDTRRLAKVREQRRRKN